MMQTKRNLAAIILLIMAAVTTLNAGPEAGTPVPPDIVKISGQNPRALTYAEATNPLTLKRYEFMLTPAGDVIYKIANEEWKYFGNTGYDLDYLEDDQSMRRSEIGPASMIAADGNRVVIKMRDNNKMYFASLVDGDWDISKKSKSKEENEKALTYISSEARRSSFVTLAPGNYSTDTPYDEYMKKYMVDKEGKISDMAFLLPLTRKTAADIFGEGALEELLEKHLFELPITKPPIPYCWPVVMEAGKWYRIKAENLAAEKIVDIGVFCINKVSGALAEVNDQLEPETYEFYKPVGSEYRRPYNQRLLFGLVDPAGNAYLTGVLRDYCAYVDGTTNYYVLTMDEKNNQYQPWNIDEQTFFCGDWYKFAEAVEEKMSETSLFIKHNPNNWTNWDYRGILIIERIAESFVEANRNNPAWLEAWNWAKWQVEMTKDYLPEFGKVGFGADPWIWSTYASVATPYREENPRYKKGEPLDDKYDVKDSLHPFFARGDYWQPEKGYPHHYELKKPFEEYWGGLPAGMPAATMDVSRENIVVRTAEKIYSLCWSWGALDFTWRTRPNPPGAIGNNIIIDEKMKIYVPGIQNGEKGYFTQTLLPPDFLENPEKPAAYYYPHKTGEGLPEMPVGAWDFIPLSDGSNKPFSNGEYDFSN
jgi:hypothetical protein